MQISFSGGRTSAYMTKLLIDNMSEEYDFIVTFANTGLEHEKTLEFVNNCDVYFNFNTVWLEADVFLDERRGTGFKIVDFQSASRKGEPYEQVIKKYGIPNVSFPHCTRELKLSPMRTYLKSLGIKHTDIPTAIGIRNDETRRVSAQAEVNNIIYPLINLWPSDKQDVLDFWEDQKFDLGLDEHDGNCKLCFKKSMKKQFKQMDSDPSIIKWYMDMEDKYATNGYNKEKEFKRVFFRHSTSATRLLELYEENKIEVNDQLSYNVPSSRLVTNKYEDSGCSESCEVYATE